jgi:hypothetical protein
MEEPIVKAKSVFSSLAAFLVTALPVAAGELILIPARDNTLYEIRQEKPEGDTWRSNGAGDFFFAGMTNFTGEARRGLVAFDVASAIPPGSVVTEVTLTLELSRTISGPLPVGLHRVTSDWGEGTSDAPGEEGIGAPATDGDATWIHTFFPDSLWSSPGGDFSPTPSATQSVGGVGSYTWGSTPEMVADVQTWLDDPSTDFGWLVMGDEQTVASAKRFNTRENGDSPPQLAITYDAPVPTVPAVGLALLALLLGALTLSMSARSRRATEDDR